jgi:tRNA (guanine-N7-)-methyltransferase
MTGPRRYQLYGRRKAKPLSKRRQLLIASLLPRLRVDLPEEGWLEPRALFAEPADEIWLEIGFGAGEHLVAGAARYPKHGFIGSEVFLDGIAKLLDEIDRRSAANIRIFDGDGRYLLDRLAPGSVDRVIILFPDPWPKTRHHRRRLINAETLGQIFRILKGGGELRIASDVDAYVRWILVKIRDHGGFDWCAESASDWRNRPADWPATRYETKARAAGRRCTYLRFLAKAP